MKYWEFRFLYLLVSQSDSSKLERIENITQLYDEVFLNLNRNKIYTEDYKRAEKIASLLGFFLQTNSKEKYAEMDDKSHLEKLYTFTGNTVMQDDIQVIIGNSFIRDISEGSLELEFHHKTIKEYFSAKFILDAIEGLTENDYDKYQVLLDSHDIYYEIEHLKHFIEKNSLENKVYKSNLINLLTSLFNNVLLHGFSKKENAWNKDYNPKSICNEEIQQRASFFLNNHMNIVYDILGAPIISSHYQLTETCNLLGNFLLLTDCSLKYTRRNINAHSYEKLFWQSLRKIQVDQKNISFMLGYKNISYLVKNNYLFEDLNMSGLTLNCYTKNPNKVKIWNCTLKDSIINGINYSSLEMKDTSFVSIKAKNIYLYGASIRHVEVFGDSIIFKRLGYTEFNNCHFSNLKVSFHDNYDLGTDIIFSDCTFDNTTFSKEFLHPDVTFNNCKYNSNLCDIKKTIKTIMS